MKTCVWTIEEANEAICVIYRDNPNITYREAASVLNATFATEWWDMERVRDRKRKIERQARKASAPQIVDVTETVTTKGLKKILTIADLHFPHHREDIYEIFEKHILNVDAVVFAGDIFDNESLSSFKSISKGNFKDDLVDFYFFIKNLLSRNVKNVPVYIIRGNHEERLASYIANNQQTQLNEFINPQVMQMLVDGFSIYEGYTEIRFEPIKNITYVNNWFLNINDSVIICHQKDYHKPKLKTVCEGILYFMEMGEKFDSVILAHMHVSGYTSYMGKHGYNIPCMCKPQEYANNGKFKYRPQSYGYMIVGLNENGKFDINETKINHLKEQYRQIPEDVVYNINI